MTPVDLMAFPFQLASGGGVATVEQGSDAEAAQAILVLLSTQPGERCLVPAFGAADPAFGPGGAALQVATINAGLARFGPFDVEVSGFTVLPSTSDTTAVIEMDYKVGI